MSLSLNLWGLLWWRRFGGVWPPRIDDHGHPEEITSKSSKSKVEDTLGGDTQSTQKPDTLSDGEEWTKWHRVWLERYKNL